MAAQHRLRTKDLTGLQFGLQIVVAFDKYVKSKEMTFWKCKCLKCGKITSKTKYQLKKIVNRDGYGCVSCSKQLMWQKRTDKKSDVKPIGKLDKYIVYDLPKRIIDRRGEISNNMKILEFGGIRGRTSVWIMQCDKCKQFSLKSHPEFKKTRCINCWYKERPRDWCPVQEKNRTNNYKNVKWERFSMPIFRRDKFQCQLCGESKSGKLNAHHLDGYNWCIKGRLDPKNGITLCDTCHIDFHSRYGYGNNTATQFFEFFDKIVKHEVEI